MSQKKILVFTATYNEVSNIAKLIFKIRPGITSWGMVKYGYADNVEKMIERLKYDIIYIENLSIFSDIKVLAYTLIIVLQGRGK